MSLKEASNGLYVANLRIDADLLYVPYHPVAHQSHSTVRSGVKNQRYGT